jgi:hypothetical protein
MGGLSWLGEQSTKIRTMVDEIGSTWGLRLPESEGQGTTVQHTQPSTTSGADVITTVKGYGSQLLEQVKGLYNLAFGQDGSQPAIAIKHELEPSSKTTIGLVVAGGVILAIWFFGRKK